MWTEEDFFWMKKLIIILTAPNPQELSILDTNHIFFTLPLSVFEKIFQHQQQQQQIQQQQQQQQREQQILMGIHLYSDQDPNHNKKHKYSLPSLPPAFYDIDSKDILINVSTEEGQKIFVGCIDILRKHPPPHPKIPLPILVEKNIVVTDLLRRHLNIDTVALKSYRRMFIHFPAQDFTDVFEKYKKNIMINKINRMDGMDG